MQKRGELIRRDLPDWITSHKDRLQNAIGTADFFAEGRDGTGRKTRVPWVRFGSRSRSPRATEGFYVVYLFDSNGAAVYLSLNQGTTDFIGGEFVPKPPEVISTRVAWARSIVEERLNAFGKTQELIELHDLGLGSGYEAGNIAAIPYALGSIPNHQSLLVDATVLAEALGEIYASHEHQPMPFEQPELREAEAAADRVTGRSKTGGSAGFRTNSKEIKVIEDHAVATARAYYEKQGWKVREFGKPFDLRIEKNEEALTVEVKGTTSDGHGVPLTAGEVRHHADAFPDNALVVVRDIRLQRDPDTPKAWGGRLFELRGWEIDPNSLRAISYAYAVPEEMYDHQGVPAEDLLD